MAHFTRAAMAKPDSGGRRICRNHSVSPPLRNAIMALELTETRKIGRGARIQNRRAIRVGGQE